MEDPRFPIGKFTYNGAPDAAERDRQIREIEAAPALLRSTIAGLSPKQLDTPYRDGGWTVRQVIHHVPDSHVNAYIRFKMALTEDQPMIKTYEEARWAELSDNQAQPLDESLTMLDLLHKRWVLLMRSMSDSDWKRAYQHPELGAYPLEKCLGLYSWHGKHHAAHVTKLRERMGW
jgi:hypothetical protein